MWRLGAKDILELPLLTASSKMETAPIAGKTWLPSHKPPCPQEDRHLEHIHSGKQKGGTKTAQCSTHNAPSSRHTDK